MSVRVQKLLLFAVLDAVVFAMATKKRKAEEMEVAELFTAQECVTIHGVVTELSPVKCSKKNAKIKYFDEKLTDRKKTMRMVSFQLQQRSQLQASLDAATSVALSDCQVKEGGFQKGLEIVAASRSKVLSSPKKFKLPCDLSRIDPDAATEVHLKEVDNLAVMQSVTVCVKAVVVGMPVNQTGEYHGRCNWDDSNCPLEEKIGCLQEDRCYKAENVHVKEFQGKKYLSVPDKCTIEDINEIDDVAEMDSDDEQPTAATVVEGVVKAVLSCEEYLSCVNCSSKMRVSTCNKNSIAWVMLQSETDGKTFRATIFDEVLRAIVKDVPEATVSEKLLCTPVYRFTVKGDVVICGKPA